MTYRYLLVIEFKRFISKDNHYKSSMYKIIASLNQKHALVADTGNNSK